MSTQTLKRKSRIRERNEETILKAAEKIFSQQGFGAATTAEIAKSAGIPKANLHYYFNTKEDLYLRVLENILETWLIAAEDFTAEHEPKEALENYIRTKIELSRTCPEASKIFAKEIISGAPFLKKHLDKNVNPWINEKIKIFEGWIADGKMAPVDVRHLFFLIWSMTQTYADFNTQMTIVLEKNKLEKQDYETAAEMIINMTFSLCKLN
ncbi:HTH-type transcriptional regulator RutR [Candidatus Terasakiella magnetica]|uniref:HTH-type transcriptional regulator RutR n=1 Tax=Candidatus Terasakiella magnetica TaxID=1867952 RepID=A0A1C3RBY8_9PROT|nr:TetR/AcrR family transcriptional regulator [Candidatus Terasakiella magnetica]SCA54796.1 HTH-type transcriptional regulator RutR [Candidatus Terasakiella magnetica]